VSKSTSRSVPLSSYSIYTPFPSETLNSIHGLTPFSLELLPNSPELRKSEIPLSLEISMHITPPGTPTSLQTMLVILYSTGFHPSS